MISAQKQADRSMKQYIERPEVNPHTHGQLIYDKGGGRTEHSKDGPADGPFHHVKNKLRMV